MYRHIDIASFIAEAGPPPRLEHDPGAPPTFQWIKIKDLVIDTSYQRDLLTNGRRNIMKIVMAFDWAKFSAVVVAPVGDGRYAIIDGQHRTTAAALRDYEEVPCMVVEATRQRQAAAFAAINSVVTSTHSLQIHAARVTAGDPRAVRLDKICRQTGVSICRYPVAAKHIKKGETMAALTLYNCLERYGPEVLTTALNCIMAVADNVGLLRIQVIKAFCIVLEAEPSWRAQEGRLLKAVASFDLRGTFRRAMKADGNVLSLLVRYLTQHLAKEMRPHS